MSNENLHIKRKKEIRKLLIKASINNKKISEIRAKILKFWDNDNGKKLLKSTKEEKEKLAQLKYFYKRCYEEDLRTTEKIFRLHKGLLDSSCLEIQRKALEMAEKIIEKYKQTAAEILQNLTNKR